VTNEVPTPGSMPLIALALGLLGIATAQRRNRQKR
jgi:hypothetical protein